ncbi:MAG: FecR domain-containing protein, partial [Candidatus Omnitrophica bacterium]|nr:FecR domain-containing protein [Candidatus Omnitrophota bacterium]
MKNNHRQRKIALKLIALCLGFSMVFGFVPERVYPADQDLTIDSIQGQVRIQRSGDESWVQGAVGMQVGPQDRLDVSPASMMVLKSGTGSTLMVEPGQNLLVQELMASQSAGPDAMALSPLQAGEVLLRESTGRVQRRVSGGSWETLESGTLLQAGETVRTLMNSRAVLEYADQTVLTLKENSVLTLADDSLDSESGTSRRELKLDLGSMHYKVSKIQEKGSEFKIHSSTAIVGITGTEGTIVAGGEGKPTSNILLEGSTYNMDAEGQNGVALKAGNVWTIGGEEAPLRRKATAGELAGKGFTELHPGLVQRLDAFLEAYDQKRLQGYNTDSLNSALQEIFLAASLNYSEKVKKLLASAEQEMAGLQERYTPEFLAARQELAGAKAQLDTLLKAGPTEKTRAAVAVWHEAEKSWKQKDLDEMRDHLQRLNRQVASISLDEQGLDKIDSLKKRLEEFDQSLMEKEQRGYLVDGAQFSLNKAVFYADRGELTRAESLLLEAQERSNMARTQVSETLSGDLQALAEKVKAMGGEGYDVAEVAEQLKTARVYNERGFKSPAAQLYDDVVAALPNLRRKLSAESQYKIALLGETLDTKAEAGYELGELRNRFEALKKMAFSMKPEKLDKDLNALSDEAGKLSMPAHVGALVKRFETLLEEKKAAGYEVRPQVALQAEAQTLVNQGLPILAQEKYREGLRALSALKDTTPPSLQVGDLDYAGDQVKLSGLAFDKVDLEAVWINGNRTEAGEDGKFEAVLKVSSSWDQLKVWATDTSGNRSPVVQMPLDAEWLSAQRSAIQPVELEDTRASLEIAGLNLRLAGSTAPGATLQVGEEKILADAGGRFSMRLAWNPDWAEEGLTLVSMDASGQNRHEQQLPVVDSAGPAIQVAHVRTEDMVPPNINVQPLDYVGDTVEVKGRVSDELSIVLKGIVQDASGIQEVRVDGQPVELGEGGALKTHLAITAKKALEGGIKVSAVDQLGNSSEFVVPIDAVNLRPILTVNSEQLALGQGGEFEKAFSLQEGVRMIRVRAVDAAGNKATTKELRVSDRIAPKIELAEKLETADRLMIQGRTEPEARLEVNGEVLAQAGTQGDFLLSLPRKLEDQAVSFVAVDASGNRSSETALQVPARVDYRAPKLIVSNVKRLGGARIQLEGWVWDDLALEGLQIDGQSLEVDEDGHFVWEGQASSSRESIEVLATDRSGKQTQALRVLTDKVSPELKLAEPVFSEGAVEISGQASDDVYLKEVRVNNIPAQLNEDGSFMRRLAVNRSLESYTVEAIDGFGNVTSIGPKQLNAPEDNSPPLLQTKSLSFGSPEVHVAGQLIDDVGVGGLWINGVPAEVYENGSYQRIVPLAIEQPKVKVTELVYGEGTVGVLGEVVMGDFTPKTIQISATDLEGNEAAGIESPIDPLSYGDLLVTINRETYLTDAGNFEVFLSLDTGLRSLELIGTDPFGTDSEVLLVGLETTPPVLELNPLEYRENEVIVSGTATDEGSGLKRVMANGINADLNGSAFELRLALGMSTLQLSAEDRLGNVTFSEVLEVLPPDQTAPVFNIEISPQPALVGSPLNFNVQAFNGADSEVPDALNNTPELLVILSTGETESIPLQGSGSVFYATLDLPADAPAGTAELRISGRDEAGNEGQEILGPASFLINATDLVPPSFAAQLDPPSPEAGGSFSILVQASESLSELPKLEVELPGGELLHPALSGSLADGLLNALLTLSAEIPAGMGTLRVSDGLDVAGNRQSEAETLSFEILRANLNQLDLVIERYEMTGTEFILQGITVPQAMVRLKAADYNPLDLPADASGRFMFRKLLSAAELDELRLMGEVVEVRVQASNYAGLSSEEIVLLVRLPEPEVMGQGFFRLLAEPPVAHPGDSVHFRVETQRALREPPAMMLRLEGGMNVLLPVSGQDQLFEAFYQTDVTTPVGPALLEISSKNQYQSFTYQIDPLGTYGMGGAFFMVTAMPDPGLIGGEVQIQLEAPRAVERMPRLVLESQGQRLEVPVSGSGRFFSAGVRIPSHWMPGPAMWIVNPERPTRTERPYGLVNQIMQYGEMMHFSARVNPDPMVPGLEAQVSLFAERSLNTMPSAFVTFSDGRRADIALTGALPGMQFEGRIPVPELAPYGPVRIGVLDSQGQLIGEGFASVGAGMILGQESVRAIPMRDVWMPGDYAELRVESDVRLRFVPTVKMMLVSGRILMVPVQGPVPGKQFYGGVMLPPSALPGPVSIDVYDETGRRIGGGMGHIGGGGRREGDVKLALRPDSPGPNDPFELNVETQHPLYFLPTAVVEWMNGTRIDVPLQGAVPGNWFSGHGQMLPTLPVEAGRVAVYDDRGMLMAEKPLQMMSGSLGQIEVRLNPDPPQMAMPLMIRVQTSRPLSYEPMARVMLRGMGPQEYRLRGAIPGLSFSTSLPALTGELERIEIVDRGPMGQGSGDVVWSRQYMTGMGNVGMGYLHVNPMPLMPGMQANFDIYTETQLFFQPKVRIRMTDGMTEEIPLQGAIPGHQFFGSLWLRPELPPGEIFFELVDRNGMPLVGHLEGGNVPVGYGSTQDMGANIRLSMDPPMPGQPLTVYLDVMRPMYQLPSMEVEFMDGSAIYRAMTGVLGGMSFSAQLSAAEVDRQPNLVEILDAQGRTVAERILGVSAGEQPSISTMPYPPMMGRELAVHVDFPAYVSFTPRVVVEFRDGRIVNLGVSGGGNHFESLLSGADFWSEIELIDVMNPNTGALLGSMQFNTGGTFMAGTNVPDIQIMPDPPAGLYSTLDVYLHFREMMNNMPRVEARMEGGSVLQLALTGGLPGYDFQANLPSALHQTHLEAIEVFDSYGNWLARRDFGPAADDGAHMWLSPEPPQMNMPLMVNVEFYQDVWQPPRVYVRFSDGSMRDFGTSGAIPGRYFQASLAAGDLMLPIERIEVRDGFGNVVAEEFFDVTEVAGSAHVEVMTWPDPPMPGQDLTLEMTFDQMLYGLPLARAKLQDGSRIESAATGAVPGNVFVFHISAAVFTSPMLEAEVLDFNGNFIAGWQFNVPASTDNPVMISLDPPQPVVTEPVYVNIQATQQLYDPIKVIFRFDGGPDKVRISTGALPNTFFNVVLLGEDHHYPLRRIDIEDYFGGYLGGMDVTSAGGGPLGDYDVQVQVNPNPPQVAMPLNINLNIYPSPQFQPKLIYEFMNGNTLEHWAQGDIYGNYFYDSLSAGDHTDQLSSIWVHDPNGVVLEELYLAPPSSVTGTVSLSRNPPLVGQSLVISFQSNQPLTQYPMVAIDYASGNVADFPMAGTLGGTFFSYTLEIVPESMSWLGIEDGNGQLIQGAEFVWGTQTSPVPLQSMNFSPSQPVTNTVLDVMMTFESPISFNPKIKFLFGNGGGMQEYWTSMPLPNHQFYLSLSAASHMYPLERVEVYGPNDLFIDARDFADSSTNLTVDITLSDPTPQYNMPLDVYLHFNQPLS